MDKLTLLRLKRNPHYKLSIKQRQELAKLDKKPIVKFGVVPNHNQDANLHNTKVTK